MYCFNFKILFILLSIALLNPTTSSATIYEILSSHGLPMGLIPKGVKDYSYDGSGRFEVHFDEECDAKFENVVHYQRNVSGVLSYGQIQELSGITAQELFLWFPVKGIRVDIPSSGIIYFDVGVIYKRFSLSLFETPPDCKVGQHIDMDDVVDGKAIASAVEKSLSGERRYNLDQESQRAVV